MSTRNSSSRSLVALIPILLSTGWGIAQEPVKPFLRKAEDQDAAYHLMNSYRHSGYWGATVKIREAGPRTVFEVRLGPKYHLKQIQILGLRAFPIDQLMTGAPMIGGVYSQQKVNDWVMTLQKKYGCESCPLKLLESGMSLDQPSAGVNVRVKFEERPNY